MQTGTPFHHSFLGDDLDVPVNPPPRVADERPPSFAAGGQHASFLLKTRRMADSWTKAPNGHSDASWDKG